MNLKERSFRRLNHHGHSIISEEPLDGNQHLTEQGNRVGDVAHVSDQFECFE